MIHNYFEVTDVLCALGNFTQIDHLSDALGGYPSTLYVEDETIGMSWDYEINGGEDGGGDILSMWCRIHQGVGIAMVHIMPRHYLRATSYRFKSPLRPEHMVETYAMLVKTHEVKLKPLYPGSVEDIDQVRAMLGIPKKGTP